MENRIVVYQVFTRLFGNRVRLQKPWGTKQENGVGKFSDFTDVALQSIKKMGVTHIWFTGVLRHAMVSDDYVSQGICSDDPRVVKGRAGSPYAIKDYYDVDPDLANDPSLRIQEFEALVDRVHHCGMKVIIDIVPNHLARNYKSVVKAENVRDFGQEDDVSVVYQVDNNFYYNPNQAFVFPYFPENMPVLGGEEFPCSYEPYVELPSRWTGNGVRNAQPDFTDWYETVKLNFGISPQGEKNFPVLEASFADKTVNEHYDFWQKQTVPDTWSKFKHIAMYWLDKGVDGFRYDMAELVPVEFWSYLNSAILHRNPNAFLLAEIYNPQQYRSYIHIGKMGFLYDKVQLYDTLRGIIQYGHSTDTLSHIQRENADIDSYLLGFLENHDEQRIASTDFADDPYRATPAMVVLLAMRSSPVMLYFGQEVGEPAQEKSGFGSPSRTSIFDYIGVPHHQRWMNDGAFDGGALTHSEKQLRDFYVRLMHLSLSGDFVEIHHHNRANTEFYNDRVYSFVRDSQWKKWIVVSNFSHRYTYGFELEIPPYVWHRWAMREGHYRVEDALYGTANTLKISEGVARIRVDLKPLQSFVYELKMEETIKL